MEQDKMLTQILQSLNNFQTQTMTAINDLREEVRDNKREIREMREENNRRWDENDKKWEENNRRWDENDKKWEENNRRWEENDQKWEENERNRKKDKEEIIDILIRYDISISSQLGDKNVKKMRRIVKV